MNNEDKVEAQERRDSSLTDIAFIMLLLKMYQEQELSIKHNKLK